VTATTTSSAFTAEGLATLRSFRDLLERALALEVGLIGEHQAHDRLAADEVFFDELGEVLDGDVAIPDLLGVHDDRDALLALVETPCVIRADDLRESELFQLVLELVADLDAAAMLARTLRMALGAFVGTDEDVSLKSRHLAER
jgi:hypothetical protein